MHSSKVARPRRLLPVILVAGFLVIHFFFLRFPPDDTLDKLKKNATKTKLHPVIREEQKEASTKLRFDWTNLTLTSAMAKRIEAHMTNCSLPLGHFKPRNRMGLGSDLHVWSQVLCNALDEQVRVWSSPPWQWLDEEVCDNSTATVFSCYFPSAELQCKDDASQTTTHEIASPYNVECSLLPNRTDRTKQGFFSEYRSAVMEYLFRSVSPAVIQEAERQLSIVFPGGRVPPNLITVQIRWGDKKKEMKLLPANDYVKGVKRILSQRRSSNNNNTVSIYLATEDPKAVKAFRDAAPKEWNVYLDQYFHDMLPYRNTTTDIYNQGPKTARDTKGRAGLIALASLLVAMEANDFVLTTASNWSRLMNELRKNVVDPRCNDCTHMVDLRYGEW